jgi:hypothetical protein
MPLLKYSCRKHCRLVRSDDSRHGLAPLSLQVDYCVPGEGTYTLTSTLGGAHIRGSPMSLTVFRCGPHPAVNNANRAHVSSVSRPL